MALIYGALSAVFYGSADFLGGRITRTTGATAAVLWTQIAALVVAVATAPVVGDGRVFFSDMAWGAGAGVAGTAGVIALYRGLAHGRSAVVAPISALLGGGVPLAYGLVLGERPGLAASVGIALALPAIFLAAGGTLGRGAGTRFGVLAGAGFGLFFVLLVNTSDESGLWPLVAAKAASVALLALLPAVRSVPDRSTLAALGLVGAGDMAANIFFLLAVRIGPVAVVAVVVSLFPAVTVGLFRLVDGEAISRRQWLGVALAVTALALFAV